MLTIFTIPKPFSGHIRTIQINAIGSWLMLRLKCEVILLSNEEGTAEIASMFGIQHKPDIECNEYGTPLVSSVFNIAQDTAKYQLMCYVNSDIILMSDFLQAIQRLDRHLFLLVGQRWDLELNELVKFDDDKWESRLRKQVANKGKLHPKGGIDYFVFPRGLYKNIPPFAIGRTGWDNWLVYKARSLSVPLIDATKAITAIHQNHGYSYPIGKTYIWKGLEVERNRELMGEDHAFTMDYATFLLTPQKLKRALTMRHLYFQMMAMPVLHPQFHFLNRPMKLLTKLIIYIRSISGIVKN